MTQFTSFGKAVKKKLVDIDRNQNWLIGQVKERTGRYFDDSYLHKILTGQRNAPKLVQAIQEVLDIPDNLANEKSSANDGKEANP